MPFAGSIAQSSRHWYTLQLRVVLPKSTVISSLELGRLTPEEAVASVASPVAAVALLLLLLLLPLSPKLLVPPPNDPSAARHAAAIYVMVSMFPMRGLNISSCLVQERFLDG